MKSLRTLLTVFIVTQSSLGAASIEVLQQSLQTGETMTDVRNDANLWQGYIHKVNGEKAVFHALIDDGEITWRIEEPVEEDFSEQGQMADAATTAVGLLAGGTELNPLGLLVFPVKYFTNKHIESLDYEECKKQKAMQGATGWGAAVANVVSLLTGSTGILSMVAGVATAHATYDESKRTGDCRQGYPLWVGDIVASQIDSTLSDETTELLNNTIAASDVSDSAGKDEYSL